MNFYKKIINFVLHESGSKLVCVCDVGLCGRGGEDVHCDSITKVRF